MTMAPENPHSERFDMLFALAFEDRLTDGQYAEWNALLQSDREMRREYLRRAYFHGTLSQRFREGGNEPADASALASLPPAVAMALMRREGLDKPKVVGAEHVQGPFHGILSGTSRKREWLSNHRILGAAAVVAAAAGLLLVLAHFRGGQAPTQVANSPAVVTGLVNVAWEDPCFKLPMEGFVPQKRLRLHAGLVRIESPTGVVAVIQGPAQFQVDSRCNLTLEHGSVAAKVPPAGVGFSVVTPNATVTDLGTEFGVYVDRDDETHAEVFVGKVRVAANAGPTKSQLLEAGHAVQVPNESKGIQEAATEPLAFVRPDQFAEILGSDASRPFARWQAFSHHVRDDGRVLAYYDFEPAGAEGKLVNIALSTRGELDGTCSETQWDSGHLPGKHALRFSGQSRVDVNIPQSMEALTLVAWINPENLAQQRQTFMTKEHRGVFSGMLMTNGAREGAVHWQLVDGVRTELGIGISPSPLVPFNRYRALDGLSSGDDGRWLLMAVVIDPVEGKVRHYVDGALSGRNVLNPQGGGSFQIGEAEIGNWLPLDRPDHRIRGFVGRIDELAIFNRVLSEQEIQSIYAAGSGG